MNIHTFKDATTDRRSALANEIIEDDDDDNDDRIAEETMRRRGDSFEGEEEESAEKFNEMGEVIEPFNLKNEREGGGFDENMNYVFQKENGEVDAWLHDMDEAQMERGIGEAAKAQQLKHEKQTAADKLESQRQSEATSSLKSRLIKILQPGENTWQAMRRLGSRGKKKNNTQDSKTVGDSVESKSQMNALTDAADMLLGRGHTNIYEMTREAIMISDINWEYLGKDNNIHGPFSSDQMSSWVRCGYFSGENSVQVRRASKSSIEGKRAVSFSDEHQGGFEETKASPSEKRKREDSKETSKNKRFKSSEHRDDDLMGDLEESDDDEGDNVSLEARAAQQDDNVVTESDSFSHWQSIDNIDWATLSPDEND